MLILLLIFVVGLILAVAPLPLFFGLLYSSKRQKEKQTSIPRLLACVLLGIGLSFWAVWILGVIRS